MSEDPTTQAQPKKAKGTWVINKGAFKKLEAERAKPRQNRVALLTPLSIYWFKDLLHDFFAHPHVFDAIAIVIAIISVSLALHLFPLPILAAIVIVAFVLTMMHPLLGLMVLLFGTLPMFVYQAPLLAWLFTLFITVSLLLGFKHYRTITFTYLLIALSFSFLGYILEIPTFILAILVLGTKRAALVAAVVIFAIVAISGLTGLQNTGTVVYNNTQVTSHISTLSYAPYLAISKLPPQLSNFSSAISSSFATFVSLKVAEGIFDSFYLMGYAIAHNLYLTFLQLVVWLIAVFAISNYAIKSRSRFKGAEASVLGVIIPAAYILFSYVSGTAFYIYPIIGFAATPLVLLILEFSGVSVVKALDVMKQDFREKFGEGFEDLTTGAHETFDDVADYEQTKKELSEAILAPIEHREIAGAYGVKPPKGILLFGPPGTGKTLIMRALANEIRAGFFYIKTSSLLSPYPGESAQSIANIFAVAKKHAPAVLFLDEIDSIAGTREAQESDTSKQILSSLLSEMDGFQKIEDVVIVGATNAPQLIDPSIMRPGRFDKIIYMVLPDQKGREAIFNYYFKKLPVSENIDIAKLASITNRYSGADIKNVVEEVARRTAEEATTHNRVLQIETEDVVRVIKVTKPSTSLAQLEEYNKFKMDYERRTYEETQVENEEKVTLDDVVDLEEAKHALYEAVEIPIVHPELVQKYDVRNIRGILLFGPPGTGKTMLMRAVANEIGDVHFITLSGPDIAKEGLERATLTIKQTFDRAKENQPAIIFVDEIDAIVPARTGASEFTSNLTSEFLEELDGIKEHYSIVLVAATNRPDTLDAALLRAGRIDKLIFTPPPEKGARSEIFKLNLKNVPTAGIDYEKLGEITPGYTGADISNVCRQVKMNVLERSLSNPKEDKITMEDLESVIENTRASAPSLVVGRYMSFISHYGQR